MRPGQLKPLDWLGRDRERFKGFFTANPEIPVALTGAPAEVCVGPVRYTGQDLIGRDLANLKAAASGADLSASRVSEWMTADPQTASPDTPAEDAAQIMLLNGFRHLPIVEGRRVHGVVSLRDLFSARISRPPQPRSAAS